jgi:hypothetical protein
MTSSPVLPDFPNRRNHTFVSITSLRRLHRLLVGVIALQLVNLAIGIVRLYR